eukprot:6699286-Prymnesium_polylepis.1
MVPSRSMNTGSSGSAICEPQAIRAIRAINTINKIRTIKLIGLGHLRATSNQGNQGNQSASVGAGPMSSGVATASHGG